MNDQPRIFALDDDPFILEVLREGLSELGTVEGATLWSELSLALIRAAGQHHYVFLICDLNMPGMDGLEFCRIVNRFAPKVRIIVYSAAITPEVRALRGTLLSGVVSKDEGIDYLREILAGLILAYTPPPKES
jgi:CheY-like chemotaxis protein